MTRTFLAIGLSSPLLFFCGVGSAGIGAAIGADAPPLETLKGRDTAADHGARRVGESDSLFGAPSGETTAVQKNWGEVVFYRGFPRSLMLRLGSGADLLPGFSQEKEYGAVEWLEEGIVYSSLHDDHMRSERTDGGVAFRGQLRSQAGAVSKAPVDYFLNWTVSDLGFVKLEVRLQPQGAVASGSASYKFPFNGAHLNRYYYTGFQPASVRKDSSLAKEPFEEISAPGLVVQFRSHVIQRIVGFIRSETEALNVLPGSGFFRELTVTNGPPAVLTYVDDTPASRREVIASFYVLPAPVRACQSLRRIIAAYFTDDRPLESPGGVNAFLDTLSSYGIKDFIYHTWRFWNFQDPTTEVSCLASDPERLQSLIREAHARGMRVILYLNLIPEEKQTVWYQKHDAGRWRTEHPFSVDMVGELSQRRDVMDLNSPFYEHRLRDIDYILDTIGADGVFVDWFTAFACSREHEFNRGIPTHNINRLIDLISYVRGKGKLIYLHSSEESRIPYLENLADRCATGERPWDRVTSLSTARGLFDRWTSSKGDLGVILDSRMAVSDAEVREEVNWSLLEGLNPFGYAYLVKWYGVGPTVRARIKAGEPESSIRFHDEYPFTLLKSLQPYDLESMTLIPAKEAPARSDDPHVGVSAVAGPRERILFVVNTDMVNEHAARLWCNDQKLNLSATRKHAVIELTAAKKLGEFSGEELARGELRTTVPANTCLPIAILDR